MAQADRAVIIIGAGLLQVPLIRAAQQLRLAVLATDGNPDAPGLDLAEEALVVSTHDAAATVLALQQSGLEACYTLKGVCTAGADCAPTVAAVAEAFGLPGIPRSVAVRTYDKFAVRAALSAGLGCYQPVFDLVRSNNAPAAAKSLGYPLVVKPLTERASRGVTIVADEDALLPALEKAAVYNPLLLLEQRLSGSEHSAEAILKDGVLLWFNIVDRFFDYTDGIPIELGHVNPTSLDAHAQQQIQFMLLSCARVLGISWGPFKVDCIVTDDGPKVLELTARLSGGWDCQRTSPMTGRYPMTQLLQLATGREVGIQPAANGYAACAAIVPQRGMPATLPVSLPHSSDPRCSVQWMLPPGAVIPDLQHNAARLGFVFAHGERGSLAWDRATTEALRVMRALMPL